MRVLRATGRVAAATAATAATTAAVGAAAALGAIGSAGAAATPAPVPSAQQTHPRVRPAEGGRHTSFTLSFTVRQLLGHAGVVATDYRVQLSPLRQAGKSCAPTQPSPISSGSPGQVIRLPLRPPRAGWCKRRYTVTVWLERGPYCPPPAAGQPPPPCPEFATQDLDTGRAHFTVR